MLVHVRTHNTHRRQQRLLAAAAVVVARKRSCSERYRDMRGKSKGGRKACFPMSLRRFARKKQLQGSPRHTDYFVCVPLLLCLSRALRRDRAKCAEARGIETNAGKIAAARTSRRRAPPLQRTYIDAWTEETGSVPTGTWMWCVVCSTIKRTPRRTVVISAPDGLDG